MMRKVLALMGLLTMLGFSSTSAQQSVKPVEGETCTLTVEKMHCNACAERVRKVALKLEGVTARDGEPAERTRGDRVQRGEDQSESDRQADHRQDRLQDRSSAEEVTFVSSARVALKPIPQDDRHGIHDQEHPQKHDDAGGGVLAKCGLRPRDPVEDLDRQHRER